MPAPVIRGSGSVVAGLSATSPAGTQVGDLVMVFTFERLGAAGGSTLTLHSSMDDEVINHFHNDGSNDGAFGVAWKIATSAGAVSYQGFTSSNGSPNANTGLRVYQAGTFDEAGILGAAVSSTSNAAPNPPNLAGLDAGLNYSIEAVGAWWIGSASAVSITAPSGYANKIENGGSDDIELSFANDEVVGVTSVDPGAFADNVTPAGTVAATIAIPELIAGNDQIAGDSDGAATATGTGRAYKRGAGDADGIATVSGDGRAYRRGAGAAAGAGTASATGVMRIAAVGSAAGSATVTGVGQLGANEERGAGNAPGVASVSGFGRAYTRAAASAVAAATTTGQARVTARGAGASAGEAIATADALAFARGVGSTAGVSQVSGVGAATGTQSGAGSAQGMSTAQGAIRNVGVPLMIEYPDEQVVFPGGEWPAFPKFTRAPTVVSRAMGVSINTSFAVATARYSVVRKRAAGRVKAESKARASMSHIQRRPKRLRDREVFLNIV